MKQVCEAEIDATGAIQLPASFLLESGLRPGVKLKVQLDAEGEIHLSPQSVMSEDSPAEESPIELIEEDGHLFVRGIPHFDINKLIEEEREARMTELMQGINL